MTNLSDVSEVCHRDCTDLFIILGYCIVFQITKNLGKYTKNKPKCLKICAKSPSPLTWWHREETRTKLVRHKTVWYHTKYTATSIQGRSLNKLKIGLRFTPFLKQNIKLGQSKKQKKKIKLISGITALSSISNPFIEDLRNDESCYFYSLLLVILGMNSFHFGAVLWFWFPRGHFDFQLLRYNRL